MFAPASELSRQVKEAAAEAGFELAGIAGVGEFPELDYFPTWIAEGRDGEMAYLQARDEQGRLKRASLGAVAPWARSVVVCALNYNSAQPYSTQLQEPDRGWISRYAWSRRDYHNVVMKKLKQVEAKISGQWAVVSKPKDRKSERGCMWTQGRWWSGFTPSTPALGGWARIPASSISGWAPGFSWG